MGERDLFPLIDNRQIADANKVTVTVGELRAFARGVGAIPVPLDANAERLNLDWLVRDVLRGTGNPAQWGVPEDYANGYIAGVHALAELVRNTPLAALSTPPGSASETSGDEG